jgi:hypothetical protein
MRWVHRHICVALLDSTLLVSHARTTDAQLSTADRVIGALTTTCNMSMKERYAGIC